MYGCAYTGSVAQWDREKAAANPGQVQLVDWATLAGTRDDINGPDGLHLNDAGTQLLAGLLGQALGTAPSAAR